MASSLSRLYIDDDSPQLAYFPFVNLEPSPNVTAGWQAQYTGSGAATAPGQVGVGTSYHLTAIDGSSLMVQWNGTGIDLMGSVSNASCALQVDGTTISPACTSADTVLASIHDLANANHTLLLTTLITNPEAPNTFLKFNQAIITYPPPQNVNTTATSYNIADQNVAFMGQWDYVRDSGGTSMHMTTTAGDRAEATFVGSAVSVYGLVSSFAGRYSVTIDNVTTSLSAQSSYNNSNALLFFATDLSQEGLHTITITNVDNRVLALRVDGMNVTAFGNVSATSSASSDNSVSSATIAAAVLATVLFMLLSFLLYRFCVKPRMRSRSSSPESRQRRSSPQDQRTNTAISHAFDPSLSREEDLESNSLSTSKGYGFGLGLRKGFLFGYRKKNNNGGKSGNGTRSQRHATTPPNDHDDKRISLSTLAADIPVLPYVPESEQLAPGWRNPAVRLSYSNDPLRHCPLLPELHMDDADDDTKSLPPRQGEALAATLSLSPRTSEAPATLHNQPAAVDMVEGRKIGRPQRGVDFLQGKRDSKSSGSEGSTWSKVRTRLYRNAHKDDGKQSLHSHTVSPSSARAELVPVVMHPSISDTAPPPGTYSFLDFASSGNQSRLRVPASPHAAASQERELSDGSNTSIKVIMVERNGVGATPMSKPDAPSTASGSTNVGVPAELPQSPSVPSAVTADTQASAPFSFPLSMSPSILIPHPFNAAALVRRRSSIPSRSPSSLHRSVDQPRVYVDPPSATSATPASPTDSVPFTMSDLRFRHSLSDYTAMDSRRTSANSGLPPHPPLPHRDGSSSMSSSQAATPGFSPPPPYIVRRVLGIASPPSAPPPSSSDGSSPWSRTGISSTSLPSLPRRPETAMSSVPTLRPTFRMGGLLGPRPRPSNLESSGPATSLSLPLQGGRGNLRGTRQ